MNILLVDDDAAVRRLLAEFIRSRGHSVVEADDGETALARLELMAFQVAFVDIRMPGIDGITTLARMKSIQPELKVVIFTGYGTVELAVECFRLGATDFLQKPVNFQALEASIQRAIPDDSRVNSERLGETEPSSTPPPRDLTTENQCLIGTSEVITAIRRKIELVASSKCDPIVIKGETGTGKEVVAHAIHHAASGKNRPFVAVSCPAIADSLIESELFGHVKGSFTGASTDRVGYFEMARQGTLFLDEVADLSLVAQAKLLRVIETRHFRPLGGSREKSAQLRLIVATNKSLEELTRIGKFRPDLYYRLQVYSITMPPLRDHLQDVIPLADYFVEAAAKKQRTTLRRFTEPAYRRLLDYSYPGNVRELRNIVERAIMLSRDSVIEADAIVFNQSPEEAPPGPIETFSEQGERELLEAALIREHWNRREVAKKLNMPYSTLRHKIKKYRIDR